MATVSTNDGRMFEYETRVMQGTRWHFFDASGKHMFSAPEAKCCISATTTPAPEPVVKTQQAQVPAPQTKPKTQRKKAGAAKE
jgi:hypothetical protein